MTDDPRKGDLLFCYAVALAAGELDEGDFRGLNSASFLNHVERLIEIGIKNLDLTDQPIASRRARTLLSEARLLLEDHRADLDRHPKPQLVWSQPEDRPEDR